VGLVITLRLKLPHFKWMDFSGMADNR